MIMNSHRYSFKHRSNSARYWMHRRTDISVEACDADDIGGKFDLIQGVKTQD